MILYFADRELNIIGKASTKLPKGSVISNDKKQKILKQWQHLLNAMYHMRNRTRGILRFAQHRELYFTEDRK